MKITDEALEELIAIYKEAPTAESRASGLPDVALFSCTREIQFLCTGEKITDLMHFHGVCCHGAGRRRFKWLQSAA
jgi:hypothetical protein